MKPKVFVTRIIPDEGLKLVKEACDARIWEGELPPPREVILEEVQEVEGILSLLTARMDAEVMDAAPKLKVISNYAVGYDNIDIPAATERGIIVGNTPGVLTDTTADLAWALLMATARRITEGDRYVREGRWQTWGPTILLGQDVHHATLGIIGMGRIGATIAKRASGFEMKVLYYDVNRREDLEKELGVEYRPLDDLLRESDFVTVHTWLSEETYHLIGKRELKLMRETAILINDARGPIVDNMALYEALRDGDILAAGLDVTEPEPLPVDHPLLTLDNVIVVPHIGSGSVYTRGLMARMAAENLLAGLKGEMPPNPVNPEALQKS